MMKRKSKTKQIVDRELRQWCIDQAIRWPSYEDWHGGGPYGGMGGSGIRTRSDADIIGRAKKIENWVLGIAD